MEKKLIAESQGGMLPTITEHIYATEPVVIEDVSLNLTRSGKVWIELQDAEGGEFPAKDVAEVLKRFFNENF